MTVHRLVAANGSTVAHASGTRSHQGGEPGQSVNTSVVLVGQHREGLLPDRYCVSIATDQACFASVVHKTARGFIVKLTPRAADTALAVGSFDFTVHG
jgi:hypothetical protein